MFSKIIATKNFFRNRFVNSYTCITTNILYKLIEFYSIRCNGITILFSK